MCEAGLRDNLCRGCVALGMVDTLKHLKRKVSMPGAEIERVRDKAW